MKHQESMTVIDLTYHTNKAILFPRNNDSDHISEGVYAALTEKLKKIPDFIDCDKWRYLQVERQAISHIQKCLVMGKFEKKRLFLFNELS